MSARPTTGLRERGSRGSHAKDRVGSRVNPIFPAACCRHRQMGFPKGAEHPLWSPAGLIPRRRNAAFISRLEVFGLEIDLRPVLSLHHHLPPGVEGPQSPTASDGTNLVLMSQMRLNVLRVSPGNQATRGAGALNPVVHVVLFQVAGRTEGLDQMEPHRLLDF